MACWQLWTRLTSSESVPSISRCSASIDCLYLFRYRYFDMVALACPVLPPTGMESKLGHGSAVLSFLTVLSPYSKTCWNDP
ncbi:hypothetical protein F3Y22_tig00011662pilonHSYRG00024 [Hibiscus syriacus]|uniref:Uncharacterized protein n=1 Tax=Hibiscus syriacus TaxID=106335 RepID=A0A6A3C3W2_HIBSY|nr:hypothetical protein F3Y22_tig00011662pilonHSYRG00024 [Hibiscus syriacus]